MDRNTLAERLLQAFLDELDEQLRVWNAQLLAIEGENATVDPVRLRALFRVAHTLKGAARAANVPAVESVCHELETLLVAARDERAEIRERELALLFRAGDALADAARRLRAGESLHGTPVSALAAELTAQEPSTPRRTPASAPVRVAEPVRDRQAPEDAGSAAAGSSRKPGKSERSRTSAETGQPPSATLERDPAPGTPRGDAMLRVHSEKLDALMSALSALSVVVGRQEVRARGATELETSLSQWLPAWRRSVHRARRELDSASAHPASALLEAAERQLVAVSREVSRLALDATRDLRQAAAAGAEFGHRVRDLRLRPLGEVTEALPRAVRDVATASGKLARLELVGVRVEADRSVLDAMREPMLHLVRNAVDHGIELPAERRRLGKPETGTVRVEATLRSDRLVVTISDDGAGVDVRAVRARLASLGRLAGDDDRQLSRAMLEGGFSTKREPTAISGRGVGLDLARTAIEAIGGSLDMQWTRGAGTVFTLESPLSLARLRAVVVRVGSQRFALPSAHVVRLQRTPLSSMERQQGRHVLVSRESTEGGAPVPVQSLGSILGPPVRAQAPSDPMPTVIVGAGSERTAVVVDELLDEMELVLRPLPRGYALSPYLAGAASLPSGGLVLVLNATSLAAAVGSARGELLEATGASARDASVTASRRRQVLVVDDSITTRTLEQSVLEGAGYDVVTAVDGMDALRKLDQHECDVVVSDVEMPRLDGFGLCEAIRASRNWSQLPVILVTAQESPEHRRRGLEAGADAYLGKSTFDQQHLLDVVRQLLG